MEFASLYSFVPHVLEPIFPGCLWKGKTTQPIVALSFDDGPHPRYTPQLLKVLERSEISASFFWLGRCVEQAPAVAHSTYQQGHWIGLHGYTHRSFPRLSSAELTQSLVRTQGAIANACQLTPSEVKQRIRDVRPPNGLFTPHILQQLRQEQYRPVMWTIAPEDWVSPGVSTVVKRIMKWVRNGALIVLHDGMYGGEDVAEIAALLIPRLQAQGYQFVTVDDLWRQYF
ncbi:MAG: polysaccharide deacetylase family protein [Leptolyngbyaceae cyanobacterium MO_188.B28]|nr:polysaccharide deacetylase family protein [Leptolyngbyaceae cyanobacterium MO_188.B28]